MFPAAEQGPAALLTKPNKKPLPTNWQGPYLSKMPLDHWGNPYEFVLIFPFKSLTILK
jgi:hypothetical protein